MTFTDEIRELHIAYLWAQFIAANEKKRAEWQRLYFAEINKRSAAKVEELERRMELL